MTSNLLVHGTERAMQTVAGDARAGAGWEGELVVELLQVSPLPQICEKYEPFAAKQPKLTKSVNPLP